MSPEDLRTYARQSRADAAHWEKTSREAAETAKRHKKYAENCLKKAADYEALARAAMDKINAELEGIAA